MKEKTKSRISINENIPNNKHPTKDKTTQNLAYQYSSLLKWATVISSHPYLYRPIQHSTSSNHYYQIEVMQISELQVLLGKKKQYLQIGCIIYNKQTQSFVGQTYCSQMFEIQAKGVEKPSCSCKKSIYFYTNLQSIALKVDIWRLESDKNSKGVQNMSKRVYIGHFQVDLGQSKESGIIEKQLTTDQLLRFSLINSQVQKEDEQNEDSRKKPSRIIYRVINTDSLSHLHHFVPSNHIFDEHDPVLGLKDKTIGTKGSIQMGDRSRLTFQIKSLSIPMATVKYLTEVSQQKINSAFTTTGRASINIKQIRLNFQFHNGWKSVSYESLILKQALSQSVLPPETNRSMVMNKTQSKIYKGKEAPIKTKTYAYDKPKQLKAVFKGQGGTLILWIQAKIQGKFEVIEQKVKSKSQLFWLPLAFTLISLPQFQQEHTFNLELYSGNPYNLSNLVAYLSELKKVKGKNEVTADKIHCNMTLLVQKSGGTIENIETVQKEINDIQNLKMEKQRLLRLKRKIRQQKRKKLIELNQEIPFLDTIQLKEQLYQQQIGRIKNQKQEQQHILLYLKDRINQLQRQAFKNQLNYRQNQEDQDEFQSNPIKVQKLPNHFIDYRPEPQTQDSRPTITLNYFNRLYCLQAQSPPKFVCSRFLQECLSKETFIQFKIINFQNYFPEFNAFKLIILNFEGSYQTLPLKLHEFENKTLQVRINYSKDKTEQILNHLLNGFMQIYLQCGNNKHLQPFALISLNQLIDSCNDEGDLLCSQDKSVNFLMQGTIVAYISFTITFTNNCTVMKPTQSKKQNSFYPKPQQSNIMNRIKRYKEENGNEDSKLQVIKQIIQSSKVNTIDVYCKQHMQEKINLNVVNNSTSKQSFIVYIFDEDAPFLGKQELSIHSLSKQNTYKFEIEGSSSQTLVLLYLSDRANINVDRLANVTKDTVSTFYSYYNHEHKICVNIAKSKTNVIVERYEILIHPQHSHNIFAVNQFVFQQEIFTFPIQPNNLQIIAEENLIVSNSNLNLIIPLFENQVFISHFSLQKQLKDKSVTFQSFQFYGWKCEKMQVNGKLWQKKDVLLKIPIQVILRKQINLNYLIDEISIVSRHINVKIRQFGSFSYESQLNINRKNSEVLIRAEVSFNQIGKRTYGVQIADKNNHIFHRIGISLNIQYPNIFPHQIINIKIPKDQLDTPQPFAYQNKQQVGLDYMVKCNLPHLLTFKQSKTFLKIGQQWVIQMNFNWSRIVNEMTEEQKDQVAILVGVISDLAIDYILFKCKLN